MTFCTLLFSPSILGREEEGEQGDGLNVDGKICFQVALMLCLLSDFLGLFNP